MCIVCLSNCGLETDYESQAAEELSLTGRNLRAELDSLVGNHLPTVVALRERERERKRVGDEGEMRKLF